MNKALVSKCSCGSDLLYQDCCGVFHAGDKLPATAEQLMRSRYSAYVLKKQGYLRDSWTEDQCPDDLELNSETKWIGLEILSAEAGQQGDLVGKVEFKARFIQNDNVLCIHEISDFVSENGRWLYHSGEIFDEPVLAVSMNQSCPCGSGKKYKRCCR